MRISLTAVGLLFIVTATAISIAGGFVFESFGLYEFEPFSSERYWLCFGLLSVPMTVELLAGQRRREGDRTTQECLTLNPGGWLCWVALMILEVGYLIVLYSRPAESFDQARVEMQSAGPFTKAFWMSSIIWGLALGSAGIRKDRWLRRASVLQGILLLLFGSKFLVIFPAGAALTARLIGRRVEFNLGWRTVRRAVGAIAVLAVLVVGATLYTNLRSGSELTRSESSLVDFATAFQEQRDAMRLSADFEGGADPRYASGIGTAFAALVLPSFFVSAVQSASISDRGGYYSGQIKDALGMGSKSFLNPRIGIIGELLYFLGSGTAALVCCLLGLAFAFASRLDRPSRRYSCRYFGVLWALNLLWIFNSSFLIQLPFLGFVSYGMAFLLVTQGVLFRLTPGPAAEYDLASGVARS